MDGPAPPEEDFSTLPISDRLAHKNWKARVSAYEALSQQFPKTTSESDPVFKPYINNPDILKRIATDANAVAQERGIDCLVSFVKFAGELAVRSREVVVPSLVDKCFGAARAGTKAQAIELALQYVEVENTGAGVANDIIGGLGAKQPKTVSGSVLALKEIVRIFGTQTTPPAPILKVLPKIFAHTDKVVRAEGSLLVQTFYQYIGPAVEPWLADLKPVQVKELKEAFDAMEKEGKGKGSLKPERLTRLQAREVEAVADQGEGGVVGDLDEDDLTPPDPRETAEPVDIIPKLPNNLQTNLTSSKWKERKEVLDDLATLLSSTPRIKEANELGEVAKSLALRIQGDANINCVMVAAACMESLASGMMGSFSRYREMVVPLMLERLKERKANVTDSIGNALDAVFSTTTLADILPDLGPALTSKNPQVKEGTLKFLNRCLSKATTPIPPAQVKPLSESLATLLEDGSEGARNESASCLGTLMKMVGERPLNPIMEGMAEVRKLKIKEAYEKATVKCKAGAAPAPRSAPPAAVPKPKTKATARAPAVSSNREDSPPPSAPKAPAKPASKAPVKAPAKPVPAAPAPAAKKPVVAASKPTKSAPSAAAPVTDSFKFKHSAEEADSLASELIPGTILTDFADANWKTRLAALEEATTWLEGLSYDVDSEVLIRALGKKGWADKNFQVSSKLFGIIAQLAEKSPSFGRSSVALSVPHLVEKLGDIKLKKPAGDALLVFAEKTSLQFVLSQAYDPLSKQKAPKVIADAIGWVNSAVTDFGIASLSLRGLIDFLKTGLQNSNAAVRTSATKALVTLKLFAGPSIKDLLDDLNSQLLNTITSEFDKVDGTDPPVPTRTSAEAVSTTTSKGASASGGDALDDLFPRVEIDSLLKGTTILADSKSDAWKTKKEGLEALQSLLEGNKRLKPAMGEIGQILKARVTDTNKAVQGLALDIVLRIATGMGKPFEKHARLFVLPVATVLSDQKAPIRTSALQTLTAIATSCESLEPMVSGISSALETPNPLQKSLLLSWTVDWFKEHEPSSQLDLSNWAPSIVTSLDDRNVDVRKAAQAILPTLISCAGFDFVMHQTNSLKPASRATAIPLIQAARPSSAPPSQPTKSQAKGVSSPTKPERIALPATQPESPVEPAPVHTAPKLTGVRRKLPASSSRPDSRADSASDTAPRGLKGPSTGVRRPGTSAPSSAPVSGRETPATSLCLTGISSDVRKNRVSKDASRWINDGVATRKDLADFLQAQMEPFASKELIARLFSRDHNAVNDHINGLVMLHELYTNAQEGEETCVAICLANFDFPLKYVSMKAHETQPNLLSKALDVVEAVLAFLRNINYQFTDSEALCIVPTMISKLGDPREQVRGRVQAIIQACLKVYAYSRVFQLLLEHGLKSKVAKTRQGSLDEMGAILKKSGMGACEPSKAFPLIGAMISDKDAQVRKSALAALSEGYVLVGERVWSLVGSLSPKDKTQLEERLRRVPGPANGATETLPVPQVSRLAGGIPRPASPTSRLGSIPRPASPSTAGGSRLARPASPAAGPPRARSPPTEAPRPNSPSSIPRVPVASPTAATAGIARPKSMLPSRLGRPRVAASSVPPVTHYEAVPAPPEGDEHIPEDPSPQPDGPEDITITISTILSSDPSRSVDALKKVQKILASGPDSGPVSKLYRELAEHTEGLIETITLQVAHIFERPEDLIPEENFRLAKHLIQTLNTFCDHAFLAESLTVDILTALLEELTLRLLETDDSPVKKVKDLSRFINMILLRLFATGRRMSIFRALFNLLLQIVKPFPINGTLPDSKEAKVAELVLKCVWKLVRNIPQELTDHKLDPVELFPVLEHFLQSVPPNEWRARAANKVPCGDMPLRTVKVIIQHVVAHYGDDVYDLLSASFDDPSATIVYPYVYRILNSNAAKGGEERPSSPQRSQPGSPHTAEPPLSSRGSVASSSGSANGRGDSTLVAHPMIPPPVEEPDPEQQLLTIIAHISSETTGALHKEGITELHHFLKAYPHKRPRVEKVLEGTGAAFRKYINRALASRAAEDAERGVAVAGALEKLESNKKHEDGAGDTSPPRTPSSRRISHDQPAEDKQQEKLSRLHDLFQYRSSTDSGASQGRRTPRTSLS